MNAYEHLPRALPEDEGVYSKFIMEMLDHMEMNDIEVHTIMIARHGKVVFECENSPYSFDIPHSLHSLTKCFTNTAVGMLFTQGLIKLSDHVIDFFPVHIPAEPSENLKLMTVKDLLTMRSGHGREISGSEWRPLKTSWIEAFFKEPVVYKPGEYYCNTSANYYMLAAIVQKVTGMTAHEYLNRYFVPVIGIRPFGWELSPEGITSGGNGISLCTEDIVKLGLFYLNRGEWNGQRLLNDEWIDRAFGWLDYQEMPKGIIPYNYHWFQYDYVYAGTGMFGQQCIVVPELDMVMALTAAFNMKTYTAYKDNHAASYTVEVPKDFLFDKIKRDIENGETDYTDRYTGLLRDKAIRMTLKGKYRSVDEHLNLDTGINIYDASENEDGISRICLEYDGNKIAFTLTDERGSHKIDCGIDSWTDGFTSMTGAKLHHQYQADNTHVCACAYWSAYDMLTLIWIYPEMPFTDTVDISFEDGIKKLRYDRRVNVNSQKKVLPTVFAEKI